MSNVDTGKFETTGYFLPEDSEFRLKKLRKHMGFLSYLAQPRRAEDEGDFMDIRPGEVAVCLELMAEQVDLVLQTVSFPAHRKPKSGATAEVASEAKDDAEDDQGEGDAIDENEEVKEVDRVEDKVPAAAVDDDYHFGMTMDQLDETRRLLDLLRAQGDLMMASGEGDVAKGTIVVTGAAIFDGADAVDAIIDKVESQVLEDDDPRAKPRRVRETPPAYGVPTRAGGASGHDMASLH
jgi:hypothetical protein